MKAIPTSEQREFASSLRALLAAECPVSLVRALNEAGADRNTATLWKALAGAGVFGLAIAEEYGGSGGSLQDLGVFYAEAGRALCPTTAHSTVATALAIDRFVTPEAKAAWLPGLANGTVRGSTALWNPRDAAVVRTEVVAMRARWRAERDRSDAQRFDLKQGAGGLVDIEFLLQALVLAGANAHTGLCASGNSDDLVSLLAHAGVLDADDAQALAQAHETLLDRSIRCTLDARPRTALGVVQTPQGFDRATLDAAHAAARAAGVDGSDEATAATDDATIVERAGHRVQAVQGDDLAMKITTRRDLALASLLLAEHAPPRDS